jgi:hypothetical protein
VLSLRQQSIDYQGGYWEARASGAWAEHNVPSIYTI